MEHKILFGGPVGAGKTTAIGAISDIPVVATEARPTDETALRKASTTVAMDYGVLNLGGGAKVHLYGTPGQERFSFMWDILAVGGIGFVLLLDNTRPDPLADMESYLDKFGHLFRASTVVIGITRMDEKPRPGLGAFHARLARLGYTVPVFEVDARRREDVKMLLLAMLAVLDPGIQR